MKCVICNRRPARTEKGYCANCNSKIEAETKHKAVEQPQKFLTYQGIVVGLFPNGNHKLVAKLLRRSAEGLPKDRTLDLNRYCEGYSRKVIKSFKACCLKLTEVGI